MKLDLREFVEQEEVIAHYQQIVSLWSYAKIEEDRNGSFCGEIDELSAYHYKWLNDNAPWMIPYADRAVINMLTKE